MALGADSVRCGDFRTKYSQDVTIFPTPMARNAAILGCVALALGPFVLSAYAMNLRRDPHQIGYFEDRRWVLGLNAAGRLGFRRA